LYAFAQAVSHSTSAIRVERWFNSGPERTSCGSSSAGFLKARGVLQSVPERLDGVLDRATREIVGRWWTRVLCCLKGVRSPGTRAGVTIYSRSSAGGVEDDLSDVGIVLSWVSFILCLWCDKLASVTWTYIMLMCFFFWVDIIVCSYVVAFCIINSVFSFVNKRKGYFENLYTTWTLQISHTVTIILVSATEIVTPLFSFYSIIVQLKLAFNSTHARTVFRRCM